MRIFFSFLFAGATVASYIQGGGPATYVPGKAFDRFITVWLENQDFEAVQKNADMVALEKEGILLTQYYGLTHPSQANYIASIGGDYFGLNHDQDVTIPHNVSTLVDLLDTQNIDWRGYFEGLPGPGFMGPFSTGADGTRWDYVRKHNPFVSFESISLNGTRLAKIQRLLEFENDVKTNTLPQYCHISPNVFNDGHDTSLDYAAQWSKDFLIPLLANEAFMNRTLILLTYDEGGNFTLPNRVVSILLGGSVPPELKGTTDDTAYTHYSILSTLQNNWNLPNLGRYDVGANVFNLVAKTTGYINHQPVNIHSANNSRSYEGFLNEDPAKYKPIPPPNIKLIGAGGQAVERMVKLQWVKAEGEFTPYDGSGDFADGGDGITNQNAPVYKPQGPAAAAKYVRTTGASAGRLEVYTGVWVYVYVLALAFSAL